ncbi:MAG: hypothetical protein WC705_01755 [Candidatus Paceibacterota bacterium]|jgi:membrane protein DedA with SNARE-associated domain
MLNKIFNRIPKLPLSALIFYLVVLLFWKLGIIPSPANALTFLEGLYESYGLVGLFIASFLEGVVYLGLYFPGSFIVALTVILSNGSFLSLLSISLVVACALTITSLINYLIGKSLTKNKPNSSSLTVNKQIVSKGLVASMLHPNSLAFYFLNLGIKKENLLKIVFVPIFMTLYGLALGYLLYSVKEPLKRAADSPYALITLIFIWIIIAFIVESRRNKDLEKDKQL